jgi:hypothetical protein
MLDSELEQSLRALRLVGLVARLERSIRLLLSNFSQRLYNGLPGATLIGHLQYLQDFSSVEIEWFFFGAHLMFS